MTQVMTTSKLTFKPVIEFYLDFQKLRPNESLKSYESAYIGSYLNIIEYFSRSEEASKFNDFAKVFVDKTIEFISKIVTIIIKIIFNMIGFFKKLLFNAMDPQRIKDFSEFYTTHRKEIYDRYMLHAEDKYVRGISPKNTLVFSSDTKIALSVEKTVSLLDEMSRSFDNRVKLWDDQNRKTANIDKNNLFEQLVNNIRLVKTHITDTAILSEFGIKTQFDLNVLSLYDPEVKDYLLRNINKCISGNMSVKESLGVVFTLPKKVMNIYLYGKEEVQAEMIPVGDFLKYVGPKEFDKLNYDDMNRIKTNMTIIDGSVKKLEMISKKLEISSSNFTKSLKTNLPMMSTITIGTPDKNQNLFEVINMWILPLVHFACAFYSYYGTIIINYAMAYCIHRKSLYDAALVLLTNE